MNNGHAGIKNKDLCMECGACARNCPTEAVTVQAGVGCAAAVINAALGRNASSCCCVLEPDDDAGCGRNKSEVFNLPKCC